MAASALPSISPQLMAVMMDSPVGMPPPGVVPNFQPDWNIINYGGWMTLGILTTLTTLFVALRIYTKMFIQRGVLIEDWFLILGLLLFYAYQVPAMLGMYSGVAQDIWNVTLRAWLHELYLLNMAAILYVASLWAVKMSILLQFITIFVPERNLNRRVFWATWITAIFMTIFSILFIGIVIMACNPRSKIWNPFEPGSCINFIAMMEASGVINIAVDLAILVIPIRATWQLHMERRRKVSVSVVFGAGLAANISSIVRSAYTFQLDSSTNPSREVFYVGMWGIIELAVGILISSSFVFPQLIRTTIRRTRTPSSTRGYGYGSSGYMQGSSQLSAPRRATLERCLSLPRYGEIIRETVFECSYSSPDSSLPDLEAPRTVITKSAASAAYSEKTLQDLRELAGLPSWHAEEHRVPDLPARPEEVHVTEEVHITLDDSRHWP